MGLGNELAQGKMTSSGFVGYLGPKRLKFRTDDPLENRCAKGLHMLAIWGHATAAAVPNVDEYLV
jgi:hypothetical protein